MILSNNTNIVIGSSLEAVLFSYYNKYKLLYTKNMQPLFIEEIEDFGLGTDKKIIWDKHIFLLSLAGYVPFENKIKHLRYIDKNNLVVITNKDHVYNINYNKLYIFDDADFLDLPLSISSTSSLCRIIDFFSYNGKKIETENILRKDDFLNQIVFEDKRKILTVSYCTKDKLDNFPEHLMKIKLDGILSDKKIKIDHYKREIFDLGRNIYNNFDNVEFIYDDAKTIFTFHKRWVKIDYLKYLKLKLSL